MEFRPSTLLRVAAPLRSLAQRFMYVGLIVLSFGLMLVGKIDVVLIDHLRAEVTNVAAPVLAALSRPASSISNGLENIARINVSSGGKCSSPRRKHQA